MTDDVEMTVRDIEARGARVRSFVADYRSSYASGPTSFEAVGRIRFLRPAMIRCDARVNERDVVCIRNGSTVRRYTTGGTDIWQYDLGDVPGTRPLNFGIEDITSPFSVADRATLHLEGTQLIEGRSLHVFTAGMWFDARAVVMDTRTGSTLSYQPRAPRISLRLHVDAEVGLLASMVGTDGGGAEVCRVAYTNVEIDSTVDPAVFMFGEPLPGQRIVNVRDLLTSAMDPDYADGPPSLN